MSKFLRHAPCPGCGSKNNLAVYDDHSTCFTDGCNYRIRSSGKGDYGITEQSKPSTSYKLTALPGKTMPSLKDRAIDSSTVNKFNVTVNLNPDSSVEAVFPRFSPEGEHVANQIRYSDKAFSIEGDLKGAALFGQDKFSAGQRSITVTEGYYDTLAAFQITGSRYPNVGVQSCTSAKREFVENFEYLNSFEKIIINFDSDEPGQKAAKEVAQLFTPGKVSILKLEKHKDANDYLKAGLGKSYIDEWFNASRNPYMPDGLLLGTDPRFLEEIINHKDPKSVPYPWEGLNYMTYGLRTSEMTLITADTGVGKTSFVKEIEYKLLMDEELKRAGHGVGFLHFEEPKRKTALGLMSIHNNKPYHFPDVERTEQELRDAYEAVLNTDRVIIWDHFGSNDIDTVLAKIRHMAALGCRYIVIDHLSIIVSDQSGDERKQLDEISTKLKTLTMNLDIAVMCVIHINRQGQVRGSAGPEQVSNLVIRLERDKKEANAWRRNITKVSVEKNREFGRTGPACYLYYDEMTGRLQELSKELAVEYEQGANGAGHEF